MKRRTWRVHPVHDHSFDFNGRMQYFIFPVGALQGLMLETPTHYSLLLCVPEVGHSMISLPMGDHSNKMVLPIYGPQ